MEAKNTSDEVAKVYEKIYSEIPEKLKGAKDAEMSEIDTKAKKNELLKSILREHVPKSDQKEIDDEFKKTFSLRKTQVGELKVNPK